MLWLAGAEYRGPLPKTTELARPGMEIANPVPLILWHTVSLFCGTLASWSAEDREIKQQLVCVGHSCFLAVPASSP